MVRAVESSMTGTGRSTARTLARAARCAAVALGIGLASPALAVEVPLEIGAGPVTHTWFGATGVDRPVHWGVVLTADVVLDRAWLREHADEVPERWRRRVRYLDEVRIRPLWFLPESLILSPKPRLTTAPNDGLDGGTGMIGASWRPVSVGVPLYRGPVQVGVDLGARLTAAYVWSDTLPSRAAPKATFFLRPGLDLTVDAVYPLTDEVRLRAGVDGQAYVPQQIGGFGVGRDRPRMWGLVRTFVEVRVRVPVSVRE